MGVETGIEWTDHTFNPWLGCTKVSPACTNCYAEVNRAVAAAEARIDRKLWGPDSARSRTSESYWRQPIAWNRMAADEGVRRRVFCASLADVFEARDDLDEIRSDLFALIRKTPSLDWLLLTKRPEEVRTRTPPSWWLHGFPANVWIGTTAEDQERLEERGDALLRIPARVRFLSCEPLLEPLTLWAYFKGEIRDKALRELGGDPTNGIDWVIVGGESGSKARPMPAAWPRKIRDECAEAGVPFFFKQWGEFVETEQLPESTWAEIDAHHNLANGNFLGRSWRVGKKRAGALLDGVEHKAFPEVAG